jgi:protein-S-isoprenylcysteine O-methyltransferase Ste14
MRPLVYSNHALTIIFVVALLVWIIPERIGSLVLRSARDPTARRQDRGSLVVLYATIIVGVGTGFVLAVEWPSAAIPWLRPEVTLVGLILMPLGVALRWWSIVTLGRYFTLDVAVRSTQTVVQSGPYRFVRHPSYSGTLLTLLGVGLALANWASVVVILACGLAGLLYRVRVEERALAEALGQPYVDYMRHTRRFIPLSPHPDPPPRRRERERSTPPRRRERERSTPSRRGKGIGAPPRRRGGGSG